MQTICDYHKLVNIKDPPVHLKNTLVNYSICQIVSDIQLARPPQRSARSTDGRTRYVCLANRVQIYSRIILDADHLANTYFITIVG